jgi:hypothetical protein
MDFKGIGGWLVIVGAVVVGVLIASSDFVQKKVTELKKASS